MMCKFAHIKIFRVLTSVSGHSLSILNLVIILLKSQLLQFSMHSIHNFLLKIYHLKCLKSITRALVNISQIFKLVSLY